MSDRATVIQTEHLAREAAEWISRRHRLVVCPATDPAFGAALAEASALVVRTYTVVDAPLLAAAPVLRVVGRAGNGLDNIDVAACRARGVEVVYTPDANTQAVVEYVIGLLAGALLQPRPLTEPVDAKRWAALRTDTRGRRQMSELVLGILGLGRIGKRLAAAARAIRFARVLYNDLEAVPPRARHGAAEVPVERLFAESDVVSIHVDGRRSNRHFVDGALLGRMKPGVILINTSRGFVVDSLSLADFLRGHPEALALLDVHEREPFPGDYPLLGLPNARLYPHLAASTRQADLAMSWVVRDVAAVLEGRAPRHPAPP